MWRIVQLERHLADGLVITAHWQAIKQEDGMQARVYGSIGLPAKDPSDPTFIPFDELTEETVVDWVKAALGAEQVESIESNLDGQLEALLHPTTASGLPWEGASVD